MGILNNPRYIEEVTKRDDDGICVRLSLKGHDVNVHTRFSNQDLSDQKFLDDYSKQLTEVADLYLRSSLLKTNCHPT